MPRCALYGALGSATRGWPSERRQPLERLLADLEAVLAGEP